MTKATAAVHFCPEWYGRRPLTAACSNNMLYPREERAGKREPVLYYCCRHCDHQEEADSSCVYRNNVIPLPIERKHAVLGLAADPTLPRTSKLACPKCRFGEAVFFQNHDRRRDTPMTLNYVCCNPACSHLWTDLRSSK